MSRKTARLTVDHLAELADPVRSCLFWELSPVDRLGFWERYGYHNDADPFEEQRYGF